MTTGGSRMNSKFLVFKEGDVHFLVLLTRTAAARPDTNLLLTVTTVQLNNKLAASHDDSCPSNKLLVSVPTIFTLVWLPGDSKTQDNKLHENISRDND